MWYTSCHSGLHYNRQAAAPKLVAPLSMTGCMYYVVPRDCLSKYYDQNLAYFVLLSGSGIKNEKELRIGEFDTLPIDTYSLVWSINQ